MSLKTSKNQSGQTLIETITALFILVMGVSASVGLAVYAFNTSSDINKQIIAVGLAREGLEATEFMRDTNWLSQTTIDTTCFDFNNSNNDAKCYTHWLGSGAPPYYCLDPSSCGGGIFTLGLSASSTAAVFNWQPQSNSYYGLVFDSNVSDGEGFYNSANITCIDGASSGGLAISDYCRKIVISKDTIDYPYNQDANLALLKVQSFVWWKDRRCPRAADYSSASAACRIELDGYFTNWKNY